MVDIPGRPKGGLDSHDTRTDRGRTRRVVGDAAALSPPDAGGRQQWLAVGGYLAGPSEDRNAVRLHDFASGEVRVLLEGHTDNVLALAFSPSGRWLASAGKHRTARDLKALQGSHVGKVPPGLSNPPSEILIPLSHQNALIMKS